jgi:heat shock protein HslJ
LLAILIFAAVIAGCTLAGTPPALDGRSFLSTSVTEGGEDRPLVAGTRIRLAFQGGNIGASAGCNTMSGAYRVVDGRLVVEGSGTTEIGCDPERHAQDDWLFGFLGARPTVRLAGNDLTLEAGDTIVRLLDREVAEPDLPLVGPTWTLDSIMVMDTVSSVPGGVVATLSFTPDGTVAIASGCNSGGGRVEVGAGVLRFSELVQTDMACPGARGEVEAAMMAVLGAREVAYSIDASTLTLTAGDRGLSFRGA